MLLKARPQSSHLPLAEINRHQARRLAAALSSNRVELSRQLMENVSAWEKQTKLIRANRDVLDQFVEDEFEVFVVYLERYFLRGDDTPKYLYVSDKLKQFHDPSLTLDEDDENRRRVMAGRGFSPIPSRAKSPVG
jgi:hypothetical protein